MKNKVCNLCEGLPKNRQSHPSLHRHTQAILAPLDPEVGPLTLLGVSIELARPKGFYILSVNQ